MIDHIGWSLKYQYVALIAVFVVNELGGHGAGRCAHGAPSGEAMCTNGASVLFVLVLQF